MVRYFVSSIGKLFAGESKPEDDEYQKWEEVDFDTFSFLFRVAEYAFSGWYIIYKN